MKKAFLATASLLLLSMSALAAPYSSPSLDTYDKESEQFAYCAGVFNVGLILSQEHEKVKNIQVAKLSIVLSEIRASALEPGRDFSEITQQPLTIMDLANAGDVGAQQVIVEDMDSCITLLRVLFK